MKKIISTILMSSILALSFASCGNSSTTETGLIEDGTLYVATSPDYAPFEYMEDGEIMGFDPDIASAVADIMGVEVVYDTFDFENVISAVQSGQDDVGISCFSEDPDREGQVTFSDPYYTTRVVALLPADSTLTSNDELKGARLSAGLGTTAQPIAEELSDDVTLLPTSTGLPNLLSGGSDAYICDEAVAKSAVATGKYKVLEDEPLKEENICMVFGADNQVLADNVNEALDEFMATDDYSALLEKYGL